MGSLGQKLKMPKTCEKRFYKRFRVVLWKNPLEKTLNMISKLFYIISRPFRRVKFGTILKYHEWYLCQISRTNHAITCLYYNLRNFCNLTPCVYFRPVVSLRRRANWFRIKFLFSAQLVQALSQVDVLFLVFWFSEFSFSS